MSPGWDSIPVLPLDKGGALPPELLRFIMMDSKLACIWKVETTEGPITVDKQCLSAFMKHKARSIGQSSRRHASEEEQRPADEGRYVRVFGQNSTDSLVGVSY